VTYLDYDHKQNLFPYLVEDAVVSNPESIKASRFALQGFDAGRSRIIPQGIYFFPMRFWRAPGRKRSSFLAVGRISMV
jgi:hypothetical protein